MKKITLLLLIAFLSCVTSAYAITQSITYTFNSKDWGATIDNGSAANWTSGQDGNQFTKNQGVQITTGVSGANATSPIDFSFVSSIDVKYCTNSTNGKGSINIQIGTKTAMNFSVSAPSSGGTKLKETTFTPTELQSGKVKISVDCTKNSIYIYSVTVNYEEPDAKLTAPTVSLAAGTYYETKTLTITAPEGATLEGYLDDETISGTSFSTTLELVAGETKKYELIVSAKKDDVSSDIVSAEYTIDGQVFDAEVTGTVVIADQTGSALWGANVTEGTLTDIFGHVFNLTCVKSTSGATGMTINKNSNTFRMYNNTTVTFDAGDVKMTKIEVTKYGSTDKQTTAMEIDGWTVSEDLTTFTCNDAKGSQTITFTPTATNAWSSIKITYKGKMHYDKVVDGAALIGMKKGKFYQVNVVLQGVKANDGVLYARTSAKSAALSEPAEDHKGFDSYEDGYKLESYQQRDWVVINGLGVDYEGMEVATGFIASYDGEKLTPVAAPAAVSAADVTNINTFGVANVFYGNYENMDETLTSQTNGYKPFFVKAKVNEVAYYVGEVKEVNGGLELWGSGACGKLNNKGLKIDANGIEITASAEYQQIEGVLVADAEANGGVKLVALSAPTIPTGVAALKADGKATVYGTEGAVVVNGADGKVMIFDAMGRMVKSVNAEGAATVAMPAGYYIVRTAGTAAKVIVK